ncbi:unnamed protein product [Sphagnum jensenii]
MKAKKTRGVQAVSYGFAFSFVSVHVLGGGGLVRVGTAAAAATGSSTTLPNKMMAALQTGSASHFLIAEYQQIADVVQRGGHLCGLTSCAMKSFLELSLVVDSPKFRLTAAATPPTDPGDGNFKASRHSSSTGSATLVVDLGSLQIMVWPALSATPLSQLELPKDPSKSVDESVRCWKDTLDSSSSSCCTVWLKRPPLPHLPRQFPWAEHEQVGSNLCIVVEDLAAMLQVEGCNQAEVPLVGPISSRMESSFCRIAFTDGFLSRPRSMGGEGSISAFADEDRSAPSEVCESLDSANSEIVHRTGGGESSLHTSTENMLLGLFALSVNAQLEAFQVAFGGHRQLEEKDSSSGSSREASKIAALVVSADSSSTSNPKWVMAEIGTTTPGR